ncbi:hypothetical protein E9529_04485 [Blastococcus sp. KM273128]|uniref:hypothetical protein n=1 Tax=Blastococcus sp. KM273128 TaxID=2570314 RepID=UPI001F4552AD|nr:hypothetical protein [Blastococcus sp. KM273128]MCF6743541.1 hypothetical protein [Blastococcus sp. KM273128]
MTATADGPGPRLDDPAELDRFLTDYTPTGLDADRWAVLAPDAIALVRKAGPLTRTRVEKDIQALGAVAARLIERNRQLSLDEALADATLLDFDLALARAGARDKTRENRRGILRRLQAVHHGVPWRRERRADGERVDDLPPPSLVNEVARVVAAAGADCGTGAMALIAAVDAARRARRTDVEAAVDPADWRRARAFAERHGLGLTQRVLAAVITHELLQSEQPVAVLIAAAGLTRRDLDLGLTYAAVLPERPSEQQRAVLRGA